MQLKNSIETILNLKGRQLSKKSNIFDNISSFNSIIEIDLSNNELTVLPPELTQFKSLKILNLTHNQFSDYKEIALILQSLPNLTELHIDLEKQSNVELILLSLPQLKILNGKSTKEETEMNGDFDIDDERLDNISLNSEMRRFNSIIHRTSSFQGFSSFKRDLQYLIKEQIDYINANMKVSNYIYAINILKAKIDIYNYIQLKLTSIIPYANKQNEISEISNMMSEIIDYISEHHNEIVAIIFELQPKIQQKFNRLRTCDELLNSKVTEQNKIKANKKPINNHNNNFNTNSSNDNNVCNKINTQSKQIMKTSLSSKNLLKQTTNKEKVKSFSNNVIEMNLKSNKVNTSSLSTQRIVKSSSCIICHQLSLKQLLSVINDIYQSKTNHDQKCMENRLPKETLEQHMYTFLNKKYGLKTITLEMAYSIINGIRQFSKLHSEVSLFGKILRNELEEKSHQVFLKLKQMLIELLKYYYQIKYPYKSHGVIEKLVTEKQQSFLTQDEWLNLLKYLFPSDHDIIKKKIMEYIIHQNESNQKYIDQNYPKIECGDIKQLSRDEIKMFNSKKIGYNMYYNDFTMILLDFQIRLRDKYLLNFIKIFRSVDSNNDGLVDENEFKELIIKFDIFTTEKIDDTFDHLITLVDPFNTKKITFSDCISILSNEKFDDEMSLMDKIALNNNNIDSSSSVIANNE